MGGALAVVSLVRGVRYCEYESAEQGNIPEHQQIFLLCSIK